MARGTLKSDIAATFLAERSFIDNLKSSPTYDDDVRSLSVFVDSISNYQGDKHFERKGYKERRAEIVKNFLELPKVMQDRISKPKEFVQSLIRGGNHATNPDKDGKINASFSDKTKPNQVDLFAWVAVDKKGGKQKTYTGNDIESLGGIIDLKAAWELGERIQKADDSYDGWFTPKGDNRQNEYLVYDLKWKKGVT